MGAVRHERQRRRRRAAFTLAEAALSMIIVSGMLVAALNTVGAAKKTQKMTDDRGRGMLLAGDLMAEILRQYYADAESGLGSFGLESGEVGDGSRALWEDVDDYDGWGASPPQLKDGTVLSELTGWERKVSADWVQADNYLMASMSESGVKRITVTVTHDGDDVASLTAIRTSALAWVEEF